jgi:hypothetical protein
MTALNGFELSSVRKRNTRQLGQFSDELVLKFWIGRLNGWLLLPEVMPVASAYYGGGLVAYGQPGLGPLSGVEVHRGPWTAHFCARPTWIDSVAQDVRPASRQREGQRDHVQLALGIGLCRIPGSHRPVEVTQ